MRTNEELSSKEFDDNMDELVAELEVRKVPFEKKRHEGANRKLIELIGYYPTGEWHVMVKGNISVIKGMASFGSYEAYGGKYSEPERFATAKELVDDILK